MRAVKTEKKNDKSEIVEALKALAKEKGISEELLFNAIEEALKAAYKKNLTKGEVVPANLSVTMNRETGIAHVYARKLIVPEVEEPASQISLEDAHRLRSDYQMGDIAEVDVTPTGFLRVAAQTAKQVIMQRIREAERGKIYDEYIEKESEILTAIVQRVEPKAVYVELGRTEGVLEQQDMIPGEVLHDGDHIKVYVLEVHRSGPVGPRGPQVRVSRIHPNLVKRLFEMEVPEIFNGVVEIKAVSREAGSRTKLAVLAHDENVDAVGACIGPRGARVGGIVDELGGEKIDIIEYSDEPEKFIAAALSPARVLSVEVDPEGAKSCRVTVPDAQLSLAIGNKGQNARLAAKLTGWKIDIRPESGFYGEDEE